MAINIAVFVAVERLFLKPLPFYQPDELYFISEFDQASGRVAGTLAGVFVQTARMRPALASLCVIGFASEFGAERSALRDELIRLSEASYNSLTVLGVRPIAGRDFNLEDVQFRRRVALISASVSRNQFGGRDSAVGRELWATGEPIRIVGVLPDDFIVPSATFDPKSQGLILDPDALRDIPRTFRPLIRLPAESVQAYTDELRAVYRATSPPIPGRSMDVRIESVNTVMLGRFRPYVQLVAWSAVMMLVFTIATVSIMFLVRVETRAIDLGVRMSLGASRWRLFRPIVGEVFTVFGTGASLALIVISITGGLLRKILPPLFGILGSPLHDPFVVLTIIGLLLSAAAVTAVIAVSHAARFDPLTLLRQSPGASLGGRFVSARSLLLIETAVAVLFVSCALIASSTAYQLLSKPLGFQPNRLFSVVVLFRPGEDVAVRYQRYLRALTQLRTMPGVLSAAGAQVLPTSGAVGSRFGGGYRGNRWFVTDQFFETFKTRILAGRAFEAAEFANSNSLAVLSRAGVAQVWPGIRPEDAIGKTLALPGETDRLVLGVVDDVKPSYSTDSEPALYLPLTANGFRIMMLVARVDGDSGVAVRDLFARLRDSGNEPLSISASHVQSDFNLGVHDVKFRLAFTSLLAILTVVLVFASVWALAALWAVSRRRESGIRLALGENPVRNRSRLAIQFIRTSCIGALAGSLLTYWLIGLIGVQYSLGTASTTIYFFAFLVPIVAAASAAWLSSHSRNIDLIALLKDA